MRSKLQCLARTVAFHPSPLEHTERVSLASGPWTLVLHGVHPLYNLGLSSDLLVLPSAWQMHQSWPEVFGTSSRVGAVRSGSVRWQGFLLEEKLVAGIKTSSVLLPGILASLLQLDVGRHNCLAVFGGTVEVFVGTRPTSNLLLEKPAHWKQWVRFGANGIGMPDLKSQVSVLCGAGQSDLGFLSVSHEASSCGPQASVALRVKQSAIGAVSGSSRHPLHLASASAAAPDEEGESEWEDYQDFLASISAPPLVDPTVAAAQRVAQQFGQSLGLLQWRLPPMDVFTTSVRGRAAVGAVRSRSLAHGVASRGNLAADMASRGNLPGIATSALDLGGPIAAAAPSPPSSSLEQLIQLLLIKELRQEAWTVNGDEGLVGTSSGRDGNASMMALCLMANLRKRLHDQPDSIVRKVLGHVKLELGVKPGDVWSHEDCWKTMPCGKFRSVGQVAFCIAEALVHLDAELVPTSDAVSVQFLKSAHQFALNQRNLSESAGSGCS